MSMIQLLNHIPTTIIIYLCILHTTLNHQGLTWSGSIVNCYVPDCHSCQNNAYTCNSCCNSYRLISNTKCQYGCSSIYKCSDCRSSSSICSYCEAGYGKDGNICSPCLQPNCQTCGFNVSNCDMCANGYGRSNGQCIACSNNPYCATCNNLNINWCTSCISGYTLYSTGGYDRYCLPICSNNCQTCQNTAQNCTSCYSGYFLNTTSNLCIMCPTGCSYCYNATYCSNCYSAYYYNLSSRVCSPTCQSICRTCFTYTTQCSSCHPGYYYDYHSSYNYYCYACPTGCLTCNRYSQCYSCNDLYYLNSSSYQCKLRCSLGCLTCSTIATNCTSCHPSKFLSLTDRVCYSCVSYCAVCDSNLTCLNCSNNYFLDSMGICVNNCTSPCQTCSGSTTFCTSCIRGTFLSTSENLCYGCMENCVNCSSNSTCQTCDIGYSLQYSSTFCSVICSPNCVTCSIISTNCTSCRQSMFLETADNICYDCQEGCYTCISSTNCSSCENGFYLNMRRCVPYCSSNCRTCQVSFDNCTSCPSANFLNSTQNRCYPCSNHCISCNSNLSCLTCESGYSYNSTTSECQVICLSPCSTCYLVKTNCTSCQPIYFLQASDNTCYRCMYNCNQCSDNLTCTSCQIGYFFVNSASSCMLCPISNCSQCQYDSVSQQYQCLACLSGLQLKLNKVCTRPGCGSQVSTSYQCNNDLFVPYDGCNDFCYPTQNFTCTAPNSTTNRSVCSYIGNLTVSLSNFTRLRDQNKISVKLHVEPPLNIFKISSEEELQKIFKFQMTNTKVESFRYNADTSEIQIQALMIGDLISNQIIFDFIPESGWSPEYFASISQTFIIPLDMQLVNICFINDQLIRLQFMLLYTSVAVVACAWLCCIIGLLTKRLNGIQTIFVVQILFLCVLWLDSFSMLPLKFVTPLKYSTGYNYPFVGYDSKPTSEAPYTYIFSLSSYFLTSNLNIMFILQLVSLSATIITYMRVCKFRKQHNIKQIVLRECDEGLEEQLNKLNNNYESAEQALLYSTLLNLIPLVSYIVLFIKFGNNSDMASWICLSVTTLFLIVVLARFWINPDPCGYFRYSFRITILATSHYFIIVSTLIATTLLITLYNSLIYPAAIPVFLSCIYTITYQPYKDKGQNIRSFFNHLCILLYMSYFLWLANTEKVKGCSYFAPIIIFLCLQAIVLIVCLIGLILGCYYYYYYKYVEPKQKQRQTNEDKKAQNKLLNELVVIDPVRRIADIDQQDLTMRQLINPNISLQAYTQRLNLFQMDQSRKYDPKISYQSLKNSSPIQNFISIDSSPSARSEAIYDRHHGLSHESMKKIKFYKNQLVEEEDNMELNMPKKDIKEINIKKIEKDIKVNNSTQVHRQKMPMPMPNNKKNTNNNSNANKNNKNNKNTNLDIKMTPSENRVRWMSWQRKRQRETQRQRVR